MSAYSKQELIELFKNKAEELQKVPSAADIDADPKLPSYKVFRNSLGCLRHCEELKDTIAKYTQINKINRQFCRDCVKSEFNCEKNITMCKEDAELYFTLQDKIIE
jgi:hypothetical protein